MEAYKWSIQTQMFAAGRVPGRKILGAEGWYWVQGSHLLVPLGTRLFYSVSINSLAAIQPFRELKTNFKIF